MKNDLFAEFAARFAASTLDDLVAAFNGQVGNKGWCSAKAAYLCALLDEFKKRHIDLSEVSDSRSTSFARHVRLSGDKLEIVPEEISL